MEKTISPLIHKNSSRTLREENIQVDGIERYFPDHLTTSKVFKCGWIKRFLFWFLRAVIRVSGRKASRLVRNVGSGHCNSAANSVSVASRNDLYDGNFEVADLAVGGQTIVPEIAAELEDWATRAEITAFYSDRIVTESTDDFSATAGNVRIRSKFGSIRSLCSFDWLDKPHSSGSDQFYPNSFDAITRVGGLGVSRGFLMSVFDGIIRILKPGGQFFMADFHRSSDEGIAAVYQEVILAATSYSDPTLAFYLLPLVTCRDAEERTWGFEVMGFETRLQSRFLGLLSVPTAQIVVRKVEISDDEMEKRQEILAWAIRQSTEADSLIVSRKRRNPLVSWLTSHCRRVMVILMVCLFDHDWLFALIGLFNRQLGFIESVFLCYPANDEYALAYVYPRRLPKVKWNPFVCGVLWQNGRFTLQFSVSSHNGEFSDPDNLENLRRMSERMERIRQLIGAKQKTFAGTLPGILNKQGIISEAPEADVTALAVVQAINSVRKTEKMSDDDPIIILGGRGFIGRRVCRLLSDLNVHSVDLASTEEEVGAWPDIDIQSRAMLVNITKPGAVSRYIDKLRRDWVVINEVYPEPSREEVRAMDLAGCNCYHVVGVRASAVPSFPRAYQGGIPCCAAWPSEEMKVLLRRLN